MSDHGSSTPKYLFVPTNSPHTDTYQSGGVTVINEFLFLFLFFVKKKKLVLEKFSSFWPWMPICLPLAYTEYPESELLDPEQQFDNLAYW